LFFQEKLVPTSTWGKKEECVMRKKMIAIVLVVGLLAVSYSARASFDLDNLPVISFLNGSTTKFTIGLDTSDSDKFKIGTTAVGTNTRMTIDSSGNVGIGKATPDNELDIKSNGNGTIFSIEDSADTSKLFFVQQLTGGAEVALNDDGGNLRVGMTASSDGGKIRLGPMNTAQPSGPSDGDMYWDGDEDCLCIYNGSSWIQIGGTCGGGCDV
jgi:hypothetical protein